MLPVPRWGSLVLGYLGAWYWDTGVHANQQETFLTQVAFTNRYTSMGEGWEAGLQEDPKHGAQNPKGSWQTWSKLQWPGADKLAGCLLGKHQPRKTNAVTGRQFMLRQQSQTQLRNTDFEGIQKKERPKGDEVGRERQTEIEGEEGDPGMYTVSSLQPETSAGSSPSPSPLDVAVDDLQAMKVLHGTKQSWEDADALGPGEWVWATLRERRGLFKVSMAGCWAPVSPPALHVLCNKACPAWFTGRIFRSMILRYMHSHHRAQAAWLWKKCSTSLSLGFFRCKMEMFNPYALKL